jgi:hypothetical protein
MAFWPMCNTAGRTYSLWTLCLDIFLVLLAAHALNKINVMRKFSRCACQDNSQIIKEIEFDYKNNKIIWADLESLGCVVLFRSKMLFNGWI